MKGEARNKKKGITIRSRICQTVHRWGQGVLSNLRLSLTLRIALHYAAQLMRTTIPAMLILTAALVLMTIPHADKALDGLMQMKPDGGSHYTQAQLSALPFEEAWVTEKGPAAGIAGAAERIALAFSDFDKNGQYRILLYAPLPQGGLVAAYRITELCRLAGTLYGVFLLMDLYRVFYFLKHRDRLNRRVLRPISDMAQSAAKLSANNLSDRISVEGAKNELKDLAAVINDMLDRIEQSYNSQKQFVSDASHELRTPIAVIQGYAGMLKRWGKTDPEVLEEGINAIVQETASMKELVDRLLFLARHDKKTLMLEMERFDPLELISEVHHEAQMLSEKHRFELSALPGMQISGDKNMLKQLLRILVDNAIKYTPEGGRITLGMRREHGCCVLAVSDTGRGIAAEDMPHIFERFYRCDDARKSRASGHGLGLSIARIITTAHGGKLKVRSKMGVGTTFSVLLPLE